MVKVYWDNDFKKDKGAILDPTAPFKGICQHCKQKKQYATMRTTTLKGSAHSAKTASTK